MTWQIGEIALKYLDKVATMVVGSRKGLKNLSIPVGALVTTIELLHE